MARIALIHIKQLLQIDRGNTPLVGNDFKIIPNITNAYLVIENDSISDYGSMNDYAADKVRPNTTIDCTEKIVMPTWYDSHTHIVYAGNREQEFVDRINGLSYEEIAAKGGGILNSAKKLQETSEDELYRQAAARLEEVMLLGTGGIEIKSGYGLNTASELKMLRVVERLKKQYSLPIKSTFLGAHALPLEYKTNKQGYLDLIIDEMLPKIAANKLADHIDIFCETGYFSSEDTAQILKAGNQYGLTPKIHVNQFSSIGGIQVAAHHKALTVDHLEVMNEEDIDTLSKSNTMAVALPTCSYFLSIPYTPARELIKQNIPLALASDYNPGSTPSGNMNFVVSTACIKMRLTPEEAINAATLNGAYAMGIADTHGSITRGKKANLIITKAINSYNVLPYAFGSNYIEQVFINGKKL